MAPADQPARINRLFEASLDWFGMLAAMELDLFTPLDAQPMRAAELAAARGLDAEKLDLLLHGLVVAGFLSLEDGRFANTEEAQRFLVRGKPGYRGGVHTLWSELSAAMLQTAASVRTGVAQARHDYAEMPDEALEAVVGGNHAGALARGRALAARYDFGGCRTVLDAAGGSGGLAIGLLERYPDLRCTVADLPRVVSIARRFTAEAGLEERVATVACNLVEESAPGPFDAAVLSYFTQVLSRDEARAALRHVAGALRPGGTAYLLNQVLDDSRLAPAMSARYNVFALSFYDHGRAYTEGEYRTWLAEAGFAEVTREEDVAGVPLMRARKAG